MQGGGKLMSVHEPRAPYNYDITVKSACRKNIELKKKKKLLCEYFAINLRRVFEPWIFPRQLSFIVIMIIITTIIHHYVSTADYGGVPLILSIVS